MLFGCPGPGLQAIYATLVPVSNASCCADLQHPSLMQIIWPGPCAVRLHFSDG